MSIDKANLETPCELYIVENVQELQKFYHIQFGFSDTIQLQLETGTAVLLKITYLVLRFEVQVLKLTPPNCTSKQGGT